MPPVDLGIPGLLDARLLGRGGFGTVYSATEPEFGRTVAVKVLRQRFDDDAVRRAFARECRAMGAVSGHPHIVTVHRGGATADGAPYIVMDLMSGGSLADRVERGPLPWPEVLDIGVVLAGALETAHRHGVLHLDLKPANVLVSRYGEPKLADFGISRLAGAAETSAGLRASPAFTAPERLADGSATVATDVYGLGATLFTLLAGSPAFQGGSDEPIVVLARVLGLPVPDLRGRGVPDPVCRVLERLMAKSPDERYATAAAAAEALQDAQRATGRPPTRPVVEGAPTAREEAAAATSLALGAVPAVRPGSPTVDGPGPPATPGSAPTPGSGPTPGGTPTSDGTPPYAAAVGSGPPPGGMPRYGSGHPHGGGPGHGGGWAPGGRGHGPPPPFPHPPTPRPRGRGVLVASVVAVLVVAAAVTTAVLLTRPAGTATVAGPTPSSSAGPTSPTSAPPATGPAVAVAPGLTDPRTGEARTLLDAYVTAINEERYADAFALFSPDSATAAAGLDAWLAQQEPRRISDARLVDVRGEGPDDVRAVLRFRSTQDPGFSPDGQQDCLDWELSYDLAGPAPGLLIRSGSTVTDPSPC